MNKFQISKGFTLIELLIIFAISTIIIGIGVNAFNTYNNSQVFNTAVSDVSNALSIARSKAISQVKPNTGACSTDVLGGYKVTFASADRDYSVYAVCGNPPVDQQVDTKKLPGQLTFQSGSVASILFDVSTGIVTSPGAVTITSSGKTRTITIDKIGNVSLQ